MKDFTPSGGIQEPKNSGHSKIKQTRSWKMEGLSGKELSTSLAFIKLVPGDDQVFGHICMGVPRLDFQPFCEPVFLALHYQTHKTAENPA